MFNDSDFQFSLFERLYSQNKSNIFIDSLKMLNYWSRSIEKKVVTYGIDTPVYVGFQHLSRFDQVTSQYEQIAQKAPVWVFAQADQAKAIENQMIHFISLEPFTKLTQEWFIIVNHPQYARALVAREINPLQAQGKRQFQGMLTSDPSTIEYAYRTIEDYVKSVRRSA